MAGVNLPYSPLRWTLYDGLELFQGFDPAEPGSWALTTDFAIYRHYVAEGGTAPSNPFTSMMQALHDNSISQALKSAVAGRKAAAIMGGHKMDRHSPSYRDVALLSRRLARADILSWHYGHEPATPLASHIAKYFQNSIREDGLLALAQQGIIFAEGKAGTIQEIFQDATQNYYRVFDYFSPMVLFGVKYWTETIPVTAVLKSLLSSDDFQQNILLTDDVEAAAQFIERFTPAHL